MSKKPSSVVKRKAKRVSVPRYNVMKVAREIAKDGSYQTNFGGR